MRYYLIHVYAGIEPDFVADTNSLESLVICARNFVRSHNFGKPYDSLFGLCINESGEPEIFAFTNDQLEDD